jgi:DNA repair protein RecO (recombination protein O)
VSERPRSYRTDALILARRPLGEADSVFTLLTPELGRFDAVARGVRKAQSKLRGHLEALTCVHLQLARGKTLDVITQVASVEPFRAVREDLDRAALAQYVAEVTAHVAQEHQPQPEVYRLAMLTLSALAAGAAEAACRYFELHLLAAAGYDPRLEACATCDGRLSPQAVWVAPESGGLVCGSCASRMGPSRQVGARAAKVLRFARQASLTEFMAVRMDAALDAELRAVLGLLLRHIIDREVRSARFLDDLRRLDVTQTMAAPGGVH